MIRKTNVKVNLGLNVLRKREDGFHDLETLFVPYFGLGDELEIIKADDYSQTIAKLTAKYGPSVLEDECPRLAQGISADGKCMITIAREEGVDWEPLKDLTVKAYQLLDKEFNLPSVKIFLEKLAPVGAGLGGGSADAAFALKMLNELFEIGLSEQQLEGFAAQLGSDCALFIKNIPLFGEGRGEILEAFELPALDELELEVVVPEGVAVSTKEAYGGIVPIVPEIRLKEALREPVERWKELIFNDFEKTVFAKHPELELIKHSLYESGAVYASMSGSGSALFALYKK